MKYVELIFCALLGGVCFDNNGACCKSVSEYEEKITFTEKDERDSVLLCRLCVGVRNCYTKKESLCTSLMRQITERIADNDNVLRLKFPQKEFQDVGEAYPLVVFADIVNGVSLWWSGRDRLEAYESGFWSVFDKDLDNSRRVQALKVFIKSNNRSFIRKMLEKGVNIANNPEPIHDLILCCYGKRSVLEPTSWCDFFQRMFKSLQRPSSEPEIEPDVFCKRSLDTQISAMDIACLLIDHHAAGLSSVDQMPKGQFGEHIGYDCVSCLFIHNRFMDSQKKQSPDKNITVLSEDKFKSYRKLAH